MAIRNIDAIVDKEGLGHLKESEYINKYYNEALANQGQRNTQERIIGYSKFNLKDMFKNIKGLDDSTIDVYISTICVNSCLKLWCKKSGSIYNIKINDEYSEEFIGSSEISDYTPYINLNSYEQTNDKMIGLKELMIIRELCKCILDNEFNDNQEHIISFPIEYEFEYIYDGVNTTSIYGGNSDIYLYTIPEQYINTEQENIYQKLIYTSDIQDYIKTSVYGFTMDIDTPVVKRKFVLPYIKKSDNNDNKTWWINDKDSYVSAEALDAMNLNIVLLYTYYDGNKIVYRPLSGLNNEIIKSSDDYSSVLIQGSDNKIFSLNFPIPEIISKNDDEYKNYEEKSINLWNRTIENSTLVIISNIQDCYNNSENAIQELDKLELKERYGENGIITTIWTYNKEDKKYEIITIDDKDNSPIALDFGRIGNFSSLIDYKANQINQINPDNFEYRHLIFKNPLEGEKQSTEYSNIFPTIRNIIGTDILGSTNNSKDYLNNFNFSIRYVSSYDGIMNKNISSLGINNETSFFKPSTKQQTTDALYRHIENNATSWYAEYVPNVNIPIFDLSEMLTKDLNIINRYNILSFDNTGTVYYAYLGTSFNEIDKSILHLSTNNTNINLGHDTLMNEGDQNSFKTHDGLSIDFKNIDLNGNKINIGNQYPNSTDKVQVNNYGENFNYNNNWKVDKFDNEEIRSMTITPKFKYPSGKPYLELNINSLTTDLRSQLSNIINITDKNILYVGVYLYHTLGNNTIYYKHGDLLIINNLLKALNLEENGLTIESRTNDIITLNERYKFMVSSSSQLLTNITASTDIGNNLNADSKDFYIGNDLDIIKYKTTLVINEHRQTTLGSIWKLPLNI